jgi:hypothetical protein
MVPGGTHSLVLARARPRRPHAAGVLERRTAGGAPAGLLGQGVSICFMCADAIAIYHDAIANGLAPARPYVGNGLWVTSFTDPDGYRLDFESPTDVPEETILADRP